MVMNWCCQPSTVGHAVIFIASKRSLSGLFSTCCPSSGARLWEHIAGISIVAGKEKPEFRVTNLEKRYRRRLVHIVNPDDNQLSLLSCSISVVSGQKSNRINCLAVSGGSIWDRSGCKAHETLVREVRV